ncbi:mitochondrial ribosomal protein subunit L20-domain-containing protein [Chaetomium fimeti]|uniref:Mitochondrial ribosomal protein subunit L20-domain-containing protein n=1 Tax=Chaetomium fimeti TaxID=1854472 RepID=A0AAE0HIH7_9PEZI|nr:mitochondrial ribosomal protein subunit L20-domain-containing protein [Chaetomium fimeti]
MEAMVTRPAVTCCRRVTFSGPTSSRLVLSNTATTLPSGTRQKSTAARTRGALNIPPHDSFLNPNSSAADRKARPTTGQIIYNPPSSAASVFHTPFIFLPKEDPRRRANLGSELFAASTTIHYPSNNKNTTTTTNTNQPQSQTTTTTTSTNPNQPSAAAAATDFPSIEGEPRYRARHHLTKADIEEMRRLRASDPVGNSVQALSARFRCSKLFVMMCCQAPPEHRDRVQAELDAAKARWGPRRAAARGERRARMGMLFNGEL